MKTDTEEFIQELFEKVRNLEEALKDLETKTENNIEGIKDTIGQIDTSNDWRR
jgi:phosphopantetheine adenylyltransferase